MARLEFPDYLDHMRRDSTRFRDVLAEVDPAAPVPSCPGWTAADLLWHLAEVQDFWARIVRERPAAPAEDGQRPARPDSYAELLRAFDAGHAAFVAALEGADPADVAWTWAAEQTVGFTFRRQAHEALIHRLDAELTTGTVTALDPRLAADGVDECLDVMYGSTPWGRFQPSDQYVEFRLVDVGTSVWVRLGTLSGTSPDGAVLSGEPDLRVVADPGVAADAVVTGTANDVDGWLWRRLDDRGITATGDRAVYDRARLVLDQPIT